MQNLSDTEKRILNRIQKDWLICEAPYKNLAEELHINEDDLIRTIDSFKQKNIVRDISAIFNASAIGYISALIAMEVPAEQTGQAASIINAHPGVSHNYLRDHRYNIWFTLAVNGSTTLEAEVKKLSERIKAKDFLILKNEKLYKINTMFRIGESEDDENINGNEKKSVNFPGELSSEEKKAAMILQTDLPLHKRPFKILTEKLNNGTDAGTIVRIGEKFKKEGIIRRYSAVLKHINAGYKANAMTVWKPKNYSDGKIIQIFSSSPHITHLYLRTIFPGKWEHGLFAMIHAKSEEELAGIIKKLEMESGIKDYLVLHSLKELKKKRLRYFNEKINI
jgi:siroheme decarboxylase